MLNLANGPGSRADPVYFPALDRLRSASVAVAGYIDTNYGQRPPSEAAAEFSRYLDWYQVDGVFYDRRLRGGRPSRPVRGPGPAGPRPGCAPGRA